MKFQIETNGVTEAFYKSFKDIRNYGKPLQIRGTTRQELLDYTITINNPTQNLLFIPFRYSNPCAIVAETLWVLIGRIDMWFLKYYLKNAMKYSDDGETWRGCFTGDTKISLLRGKEVPIKKLVGRKLFYVYTYNHDTGKISVGRGRNCRKTGRQKTIKIILDTGEIIKCTPDHRFLLTNGKYKQAHRLTTNDSIMPLYRRYLSTKAYVGYEETYQPTDNVWNLTHRLVGEWRYGSRFGFHHKDLNILNNSPSNLTPFDTHADHRRIHAEIGRRILATKRDEDESFRQYTSEMSRKNIHKATTIFKEKFEKDKEFREGARKYRRENMVRLNKEHNSVKNSELAKVRLENDMEIYGEKIKELVRKGYAIDEIANEVGIKYKRTQRIRRELGFFGNYPRKGRKRNHKIVKIEDGDIEDVYDFEVEGTHNFALSAGVFVHNSYGKRLRNYNTLDDAGNRVIVDQIDRVIKYLKRDLQTTRGMLIIPDGSDYQLDKDGKEYIDEPCTLSVQYIHRNSGLHCFVRMRSNDAILGCYNVNLYEWTFLQQLIANELNTDIGPYSVNAVSMHIYSNWMNKYDLVMNYQLPVDIYSLFEPEEYKLWLSWSEFKKDLPKIFELDLYFRSHRYDLEILLDQVGKQAMHPDMDDLFFTMMVSTLLKHKLTMHLPGLFACIQNPIYKIACMEYAARRLGPSYKGFMETMCINSAGLPEEIHGKVLQYVIHSYYEKKALEELEGVRR